MKLSRNSKKCASRDVVSYAGKPSSILQIVATLSAEAREALNVNII